MNEEFIGTKNEEFTLSIDLAPTMLQAAGIDVPKRMQGSDMSWLYRKTKDAAAAEKIESKKWRNSFYYEFPGMPDDNGFVPVEALVQKDFKYFYWPKHNYEELFHLPSDPYELRDLVEDYDYEITLKEMRQKFQKAKADAQ